MLSSSRFQRKSSRRFHPRPCFSPGRSHPFFWSRPRAVSYTTSRHRVNICFLAAQNKSAEWLLLFILLVSRHKRLCNLVSRNALLSDCLLVGANELVLSPILSETQNNASEGGIPQPVIDTVLGLESSNTLRGGVPSVPGLSKRPSS